MQAFWACCLSDTTHQCEGPRETRNIYDTWHNAFDRTTDVPMLHALATINSPIGRVGSAIPNRRSMSISSIWT